MDRGRRLRIGSALGTMVAGLLIVSSVGAQEWELIRPSNTGIPGEEVRVMRFDTEGNLWVGARWPFWREGGIGIHDFQSDVWTTYANMDSPIPSEFVNDIKFAADGTVWIAAEGGVVQKRGTEWAVYDSSNSPLLHDSIRNLSIAPNGHLWVNNSGVNRSDAAIFEFDGDHWRSFHVGEELPWDPPWDQLSSVLADRSGRVWVANEVLNGVAEYDGSTWMLHGENVGRFGKIMEDLDGNLWLIAGIGGGNQFWKFDGARFTQFSPDNTPFSNTTITNMAVDDDGTVYVGNWMGEVIATDDAGASWSMFTVQNAQIYNITPDPFSDDVWVGTPGAARHLDGFGNWLKAFNSYNTGMCDFFIDDIAQDPQGNMWVASMEAGVSRFDGERWINFGSHNPNIDWQPLADGAGGVFADSRGNIWIGTNGVMRWDGENFTLWDWRNTPGFGVTSFTEFAEDMNGTIWAGTEYGALYRFDDGVWARDPVTRFDIEAMASDSRGHVWVATFLSLHHWDGSTWTTWDENSPIFDLGGLTSLAISPDDEVWLGTNEGLVHFTGTDWIVYDTDNSPLPAPQIQGIDVRADGVMALSCHRFQAQTPFPNGVVLIDGDINDFGNWTQYHYEDSPLPHYQLGDVAFDGQGRLWISAISEAVAVVSVPINSGCTREPAWVCDGDVDGDGQVNPVDSGLVQAAFGSADEQDLCNYDVDCDGQINPVDSGIVQSLFGTCESPRGVCP